MVPVWIGTEASAHLLIGLMTSGIFLFYFLKIIWTELKAARKNVILKASYKSMDLNSTKKGLQALYINVLY